MTDDYSEYLAMDLDADIEDRSAKLIEMAHEQIAAESQVAKCETVLEDAKKKLQQIAETNIPELMQELTLDEFKLNNGLVIEVDEKIQASIPAATKNKSFDWLRENNHGKLLKHVISFSFSKGEDDKAEQLKKLVGDDEEDFEYDDNTTVHASTLKSFVKEKLKKGEELPADLFSVHRQRVSKITTPK